MCSCNNRETKEANDMAAKVFHAWNDYKTEVKQRYEKAEMPEMPDMPDLMPEQVAKAVDEHTTKIAETAGAAAAEQASKEVAKQVGSEIDEVKSKTDELSEKASATTKNVKRRVRYYVRKMPKSQREANDLVVEKGTSWAEQFNRWLEQLGANGGIFGRRSSSSSSYSRSPKNRLKGRSNPTAKTPERLRR